MFTGHGPCAEFQFQLGLWILANNIGNINTAKSKKDQKAICKMTKKVPTTALKPGNYKGHTVKY